MELEERDKNTKIVQNAFLYSMIILLYAIPLLGIPFFGIKVGVFPLSLGIIFWAVGVFGILLSLLLAFVLSEK